MSRTAEQYIVAEVVKMASIEGLVVSKFGENWKTEVSFENVKSEMWELTDDFYDISEELRSCSEESGMTCKEYSRHYDCHEVAAFCDGKWVGWTYWYGGGKWGEPEIIEWASKAYFLECEEKAETVINRYFSYPKECSCK